MENQINGTEQGDIDPIKALKNEYSTEVGKLLKLTLVWILAIAITFIISLLFDSLPILTFILLLIGCWCAWMGIFIKNNHEYYDELDRIMQLKANSKVMSLTFFIGMSIAFIVFFLVALLLW